MTPTPQTTDPTRYRFPQLFSPSHTDHISNLEKALAELEAANGHMRQVIEMAASHDHAEDNDEKDCSLCTALKSVLDGNAGVGWHSPEKWVQLQVRVKELGAERDGYIRKLSENVKELADNKEYIESLCKELCTMEDALGFKEDCHDKDGAFIPTIGPWLERVRDLIAAEGEAGDLRTQLEEAQKQVAHMLAVIETARNHDHADGDATDCVLCAAIASVLDAPSFGQDFIHKRELVNIIAVVRKAESECQTTRTRQKHSNQETTNEPN